MSSRYELVRGGESIVGAGAFGRVEKVRRRWDRKVLACKTIVYDGNNNTEARAKLEFGIISSLDHPNIAKFLDVDWKPRQARLYMEYYEFHSLSDLIQEQKMSNTTLSEPYLWSIMYQLSSALVYCHKGIMTSVLAGQIQKGSGSDMANRVWHRDIKPGNIFLSSRAQTALDAVKLGDFGLGVILQEGLNPTTYVGTRRYMPPEIRNANPDRNYWSDKCDIFSLGCTMFEACALEPAFLDHVETESEVFHPLSKNYSRDLERWIQQCIAFDKNERPDAQSLFEEVRKRMQSNPEYQKAMHNHALLSAAERADFEGVIGLLNGGADINCRSGTDHESPLHRAIASGDLALVLFLLDKGADTAAKTRDGLSTLHVAASCGPEEVFDSLLEMLLDSGAVLTHDKRGWQPIHAAAACNRVSVIRALQESGSSLEATTKDAHAQSLLHIGAENGHEAVVEYLLAEGVSTKTKKKGDETALHSAASRGHHKIVQLLISAGIEVACKAEKRKRSTALHLAAAAGHSNVAIALLKSKADVEVLNSAGETPLHVASKHGRDIMTELLIKHGSRIEGACGQRGTALHLAADAGHLSTVDCLLRNKANVRRTASGGESALHWTAIRGHIAVAESLIEWGAPIDIRGANQATPLHWAIRGGQRPMVEFLVAKHANVTLRTHSGDNALLLAAFYGRADMVEYFLQDFDVLNISMTNLNGETALHRAVLGGHAEVLRLLLDYGADLTVRSADKQTALQLAQLKSLGNCIQVLRSV